MLHEDLYPQAAAARVVSLRTAAALAGISTVTLRRLIASGNGPRVLRLSERRLGIRVSDLRDWLESRAVEPEAAA